MCWSEKCCYYVRLDLGCLLIGVQTLILSSLLTVSSALFMAMEEKEYLQSHFSMHRFLGLVHMDVNYTSKQLIYGIVLFIAILWIIVSMLLLVGVKMKLSGFVLSYFAFGIFLTFFALLSCLLLTLNGVWMTASILLCASLIHIHYLVAIHTFYELQVRGKVMMTSETEEDGQVMIEA